MDAEAPKVGTTAENLKFIRRYWLTLNFFPNRLESFCARHWIFLVLVPYALFVAWGFYLTSSNHLLPDATNVTAIIRDPYVSSLGIALVLCAFAFSLWEKSFRTTFSNAVALGFILKSQEGTDEFRLLTVRFRGLLSSKWRYIVIFFFVMSTIYPNRYTIIAISKYLTYVPKLVLFQFGALIAFLIFSYAVGAVAWCLFASARWIALLSKSNCVRIQPGHSDECCGVEPIGNCCLQSSVPLIIGMVLCLVWSNSNHLIWFSDYPEGWRSIIVPYAYIMILVLFALACALVFVPIWSLHRRMEIFKRERHLIYSDALIEELPNMHKALATDDQVVGLILDRVTLVRNLDPVVLKLSDWPFNRAALIKYAITPSISLVASLGTQFVHKIWQ